MESRPGSRSDGGRAAAITLLATLTLALSVVAVVALCTGGAAASAGGSNVTYANASVSPDSVYFGTAVTATATANNSGAGPEAYNASLTVAGRDVAWENGTLDAGNETTVRFEWTPRRVGSQNVTVAGNSAGTVDVRNAWPSVGREPGATGSDPTATEDVVGVVEAWTTGDIPIHGPPSVRNGTLYYGSGVMGMFYVEDGNGKYTLVAANASDGSIRWSFGTGFENTLDGEGRSTPTVSGTTAYVRVSGARFGLYAVNLTSGDERWHVDLGLGSAGPAATDGRIFVTGGRDGPSPAPFSLGAVDRDGATIWQNDSLGALDVTPTVVDGAVVVGTPDGTVHAFDVESGTPRWTTSVGNSSVGRVAATNHTVYATAGTNLTALDATDGTPVWGHDLGANATGPPAVTSDAAFVPTERGLQAVTTAWGVADGERALWRTDFSNASTTAATVANGYVAVGLENDTVVARDVDDGSRVWSHEFGETPMTPTVHGGRVYVGLQSDSAGLVALDEVHADQSVVRVEGRRLSTTSTDEASDVEATVEVRNRGGASGTFSIPVRLGGGTIVRDNGTFETAPVEVVGWLNGTVAGQSTTTASLTLADLQPGSRRVTIGAGSTRTLTVADEWSSWNRTLDDRIDALASHGSLAYAVTDAGTLHAVEDGQVQWKTSIDGVLQGEEWFSPRLATFEGGAVVTPGGDELLGIDPATGDTIWNESLASGVELVERGSDGLALVTVSRYAGNTTLQALHPENGTEAWSVSVNGRPTAVAGPDDGVVYLAREFGSGTRDLAAIDTGDGSVHWNRSIDASGYVTDPVGGRLFVTTENETALAVDASNGSVHWRQYRPATLLTGPVPAGTDAVTVAYGDSLNASDPDRLLRFDGATGALEWRWEPLSSAGVPVVRNGTTLVPADPGVLHAVGRDGSREWTFVYGQTADASPVLADDVAVVPGGSTLYGVRNPRAGRQTGSGDGSDESASDTGSSLQSTDQSVDVPVVDLSVEPARPMVGGEAAIVVTLRNDGLLTHDREVTVRIDGTAVGRETLAIEPDERRTLRVSHRFESAGRAEIVAGDRRIEVAVEQERNDGGDPSGDDGNDTESRQTDGEADSENGPDSTAENRSGSSGDSSGDGQPGFGVGVAVAALLAGLGLRTSRSRREG